MMYFLARSLVRLGIWLVCKPDIQGLQRIPASGSLALAANHLGRLDAVLIYYFTNRRDIILLVAEKYQKNGILRWFAKELNAVFVDRFNADITAMRTALKRLEQGGVLVLAPEGTRSSTGSLIEGWPGISYLAAKGGVPILPVALAGTEDRRVVGFLKRLKRAPITIRVGVPFTLPPLPTRDRDAILRQYTDEIMCQIGALLPEQYRGVYKDHPRLIELINQE